MQVDALRRHGIPDGCILSETASGATMTRPVLEKLLKRLRPGDKVVVWKLDRLGRTVSDIIALAEKLESDGVELVSLTEQIDTSTAIGKCFFHIMASLAQMERDLISERTRAGMAARRAAGARFGPPHSISDNPARLRRFEELFRLGFIGGEDGMTNQQIADALTRADAKARPIKTGETVRKWREAGCPGAVLRSPELAAE